MRRYLIDASALGKRYVVEAGTSVVNRLFTAVGADQIIVLTHAIAETFPVAVRRRNDGRLSPDEYSAIVRAMRQELLVSLGVRLLPTDDARVLASLPLIERHALNASDALVLRSALDLVGLLQRDGVQSHRGRSRRTARQGRLDGGHDGPEPADGRGQRRLGTDWRWVGVLPGHRSFWVVTAGESGPGARPMPPEWAEAIQRRCEAAGVAFFFKQWGGARKWRSGRVLNGRTYDAMPATAGSADGRGRQSDAIRRPTPTT